MDVPMCPFLIWPSHILDASYVPEHEIDNYIYCYG